MLQYHRIAAVVHGFRSSFRAAEETDHPRRVIEEALERVVQSGDNPGAGARLGGSPAAPKASDGAKEDQGNR